VRLPRAHPRLARDRRRPARRRADRRHRLPALRDGHRVRRPRGRTGRALGRLGVLYDRRIGSPWSRIPGKAIAGPLKGTALASVPTRHTSWAAWHGRHPRTEVPSTPTGFQRDDVRDPYDGCDRVPRLMFDVQHRDARPPLKAWGMGLVHPARPPGARRGRLRLVGPAAAHAPCVRCPPRGRSAPSERPGGADVKTLTTDAAVIGLEFSGLVPDTAGGSPVFIAGDAGGDRPLLHEAADEGRIAGDNAGRWPDVRVRPRRAPLAVVFGDPQIALAGATHAERVASGAPFGIGKGSFDDQGRSRVMARNAGAPRVDGSPGDGRFLGAEMIGARGRAHRPPAGLERAARRHRAADARRPVRPSGGGGGAPFRAAHAATGPRDGTATGGAMPGLRAGCLKTGRAVRSPLPA
jgi:hypothetical protein